MKQETHNKNVQTINELYDGVAKRTLDYDETLKKLTKIHNSYLREFRKSLVEEGLAEKTIDRHVSNIEFYANAFLTRELCYTLFDGGVPLCEFFGYFYIHKCLFASAEGMKNYFASFNKFNRFLYESGYIGQDKYLEAIQTIKSNKGEWLEDLWRYDHDIDEGEDFF